MMRRSVTTEKEAVEASRKTKVSRFQVHKTMRSRNREKLRHQDTNTFLQKTQNHDTEIQRPKNCDIEIPRSKSQSIEFMQNFDIILHHIIWWKTVFWHHQVDTNEDHVSLRKFIQIMQMSTASRVFVWSYWNDAEQTLKFSGSWMWLNDLFAFKLMHCFFFFGGVFIFICIFLIWQIKYDR